LTLTPVYATEAEEAPAVSDYRQLRDALAVEDSRYRGALTMHRWGNAAVGVGPVLLVGGVWLMAAGECSILGDASCDYPVLAGSGLALAGTGALLFAGGPVLSNAGALSAANVLRRRGAQVDRTPAILGLSYYGAGLIVGPASVALADAILRGDNAGDLAEDLGVPVLSLLAIASYLGPFVAVTTAQIQMQGPNRRALLGIEELAFVPTRTQHGAGLAAVVSF